MAKSDSPYLKALRDSLRKKHYLYPVKEEQPSGEFKFYVLLISRNKNNSTLERVHFNVESEDHANEIIASLAEIIEITNDKCVISPLRHEYNFRFDGKCKKIEAGFYGYRDYEIMDNYSPAPGIDKKDRWVVKEKPWLDGNYFGSFDRLRDAMLSIDEHLSKSTAASQ